MDAQIRDLAKSVEAAIAKYKEDHLAISFREAWRGLVLFWKMAGDSPRDEEGDPDEDSTHFTLCFRYVSAMEHVGFDPEAEEGKEYLAAAAFDVLDYLDEGGAEAEVLTRGEDSLLSDGTKMAVDLYAGRVEAGDVPTDRLTIKREGPKIGRNDPCPCGSGRKHKRCGLINACSEPATLAVIEPGQSVCTEPETFFVAVGGEAADENDD